jgi:hypothetical protein
MIGSTYTEGFNIQSIISHDNNFAFIGSMYLFLFQVVSFSNYSWQNQVKTVAYGWPLIPSQTYRYYPIIAMALNPEETHLFVPYDFNGFYIFNIFNRSNWNEQIPANISYVAFISSEADLALAISAQTNYAFTTTQTKGIIGFNI